MNRVEIISVMDKIGLHSSGIEDVAQLIIELMITKSFARIHANYHAV